MKKSVVPFLFALVCIFSLFTSCETGMGKSVDLEAPVLEIVSPEQNSYSKLSFDIIGKCSDNIKVTEVVISNTDTGKIYGKADIDGEDWIFHMELQKEEEGELTLLCEAKDAFGNSSTRSARRLTLLVDEHAPEGLSWYVDRGNSIQTPLKSKSFLEELDLNSSENKNYPQNEKFTIHSTFYDAMNIDMITLKLYDDSISSAEPVITKTVSSNSENINYIGEGKSIYSPEFHFTHDDLVSANPALNSGKHFLRITYYAKDNDSEENCNETEGDVDIGRYILWYPESDKPGIGVMQTQGEYDENGEFKITVSVGSSISVDLFDDDGIKKTYCAIRESIPSDIDTYTAKLISSAEERNKIFDFSSYNPHESGKYNEFSNDITQDDHTQISTPGFPGEVYLIACVLDVNGNWNARIIRTEVTDSDKPLLVVESPSQNTIPEMENNTNNFKVKGYSLDKKGSDYIKIAYIPETRVRASAASKEDRAKELFDKYSENKSPKVKINETGEVIWYQKLSSKTDFNGWKKQSFEISMNLLEDFYDASNTSTAKDTKFFEIMLVDEDNNPVYKTFIVSGDSTIPGVSILSPAKDLEVHDYTQKDLVIKFQGVKNSGLGMDTSKYKITTKIGETMYEYLPGSVSGKNIIIDSDGYANLTISKETLNEWAKTELQPTFTFYATDILGNGGRGEGQRSVIFSPKPVINSITIDKNNGTYKKDDILKFKVSFSKQVKVTGTPRLILKYSPIDAVPKYAVYDGGSGSNVLTFTFVVPEGADSQKLICEGFDVEAENVLSNSSHIKATELGEGDIYTSVTNAEVLINKEIKLDGISPFINKITVIPSDGIASCTKDKEIKAVIEASENILVSGNPTLLLSVGDKTVNFSFQKMSGKEITFIHNVKNTDPQGVVSYNSELSFSSADALFIKDEAGNSLNITKAKKTGDSLVIIDYTPPASAPSTDFVGNSFNAAQEITLRGIEEGATAYYSKDGGVSWKTYNPSAKETIGNGSYKIVTRQADAAGNMSVSSPIHNIAINNLFAPVTGFNIDIADGYYREGTEFTFTLSFDKDVIINSSDDIKLNFESIKNSSVKRSATLIVPDGNKSTSLVFKYKVLGTDFIDGLKVTSIDFANTVKDDYGNTPAFSGTPNKLTPANCDFVKNNDGGNREGISLDGIAPTLLIGSCVPANGGVSTNTETSNCNITLKFSEKVYKEEGEIILRRKGNWAIPAVMTSTEFRTVYNKMSVENREIMMKTENGNGSGNEAVDSKTGQPIGPYKKITHGLKTSGTQLVPDVSTKYVLDFQYDLYTGETVESIRNALKSIGYDEHVIDVNSSGVSLTYNSDGTTTVKIQFPETIEDGREWDLIIPEKAFRDNAENFYAGMGIENATDNYSLWSNRVATPVVRIDRYSHGWGAVEPYPTNAAKTTWATKTITTGDLKFTTDLTETSGRSIAPTGYVRARIDCETPNATITYITKNSGSATASASLTYEMQFAAAPENVSRNAGKTSGIVDVTKSDLEFTTESSAYTNNSFIYVGDGSYLTARKDYVSAKATKSGFASSGYGFEGAFKTVIYTTLGSSDKKYINIEGGTAPGGEPSISGFPIRDGTDEVVVSPYSKNSYLINTTDNVWVTYEIVSTDFSILPCRSNHASSYGLGNYGQCMYITDISWESNG